MPLAVLALPFALLLALLVPAGAHAAQVGEITLLLGRATLTDGSGSRRPPAVGGAVDVGDSIETDGSGHVHVRFVDGGLVSLRPGSRLVVEDYRPGTVRFRLDHGTARSVTGRWAEADRDKYRLNTPIAAIGIKGTDFIVSTSADLTRIAVQSGAVIAAPFGGDCQPASLGPCGGESARQLSADMGRFILEFQRDQGAPRILPRDGVEDLVAHATQSNGKAGGPGSVDVARPTEEPLNASQVQKLLAAPPPPALVWGRWAHTTLRPGDTLTIERATAAAGRERIAENDYYVLYRLAGTAGQPASGRISLGLADAQANLVRPGRIDPAQVLGGNLTLDFGARRFDTGLSLDSVPTGQVSLNASGHIGANGSLTATGFTTRIRGAYTSGGPDRAAYIFEHSTPHGMFSGITNWR